MGYYRAGFDVIGVDIVAQKRYPFEFHQADALAFVREHGHEFDVIHASPPCQRYSAMSSCRDRSVHADLIGETRRSLVDTGRLWVIENVPGAPLVDPIVLCGVMFGLKVYRHRLFESPCPLTAPGHVNHPEAVPRAGHGVSPGGYISVAGHTGNVRVARLAMGIEWMTGDELSQAIPPAYTEHIGKQLMEAMR